MFDRYTDQAKRAIYFAHSEAVHRDEDKIGISYILVGLTWESKTRAGRLAGLKDRCVDLRAKLGIPHRPSTAFPYKRRKDGVPLDYEARRLIVCAEAEANRDWEYWIDTDHLLRAILSFPSPASSALADHGISYAALREASKNDRIEHPSKAQPPWSIARILVSQYQETVMLVVLAIFIPLLAWLFSGLR